MSSLRSAIVLGMLGALGCLGACSTQPPKASCEGYLTPINVPRQVGPASRETPAPVKPAKSVMHAGGGAHGR